jgi:hypothetical protein
MHCAGIFRDWPQTAASKRRRFRRQFGHEPDHGEYLSVDKLLELATFKLV